MNFRSKLKSIGYDQEDAYFHQKDRELIKKLNEEQEGGKVIQLSQARADAEARKTQADAISGPNTNKKAA